MEVQTEAISEVQTEENSQEQMIEEIRRSNFGEQIVVCNFWNVFCGPNLFATVKF